MVIIFDDFLFSIDDNLISRKKRKKKFFSLIIGYRITVSIIQSNTTSVNTLCVGLDL